MRANDLDITKSQASGHLLHLRTNISFRVPAGTVATEPIDVRR